MAQPIPINPAGLQRGRRFDTEVYVPAWGVPRQAPPPARNLGRPAPARYRAGIAEPSPRTAGMLLLVVSGLTGGLAVVSSLGLWPTLAATSMGLDERGSFFLLAGGAYLLATVIYAAWRTRLLSNLDRAPWDARLMAFANLGVGGAVSAALGVMALAFVALILLLIGVIALLLIGVGGRAHR